MLLLLPERVCCCSLVHLASWQVWQKNKTSPFFFLLLLRYSVGYFSMSYWPDSAAFRIDHRRINNWVSHKKRVGCGGIKNFMACHYATTTPPTLSLFPWAMSPLLSSRKWYENVSREPAIPSAPQPVPSVLQLRALQPLTIHMEAMGLTQSWIGDETLRTNIVSFVDLHFRLLN